MASTPYTVRWGIMATGWIAESAYSLTLSNGHSSCSTDSVHEGPPD